MGAREPADAEDRGELVSKYFRQFGIGMTVYDSSRLPDGLDEDKVVDELREVVQKAVDKWYAERGHEFLACEPTVG